MHRTLRPFDLLEPGSLTEALSLLTQRGPATSVLAGGIDLVAKMRRWQVKPECVVSLRRIPGLDRLSVTPGGELEIGPLVSLRALERFADTRARWPVLYDAVSQIASVQVKSMGTVIGNLCVATPASDVAVALYVLDARLTLAGPHGERTVPIEDFFVPVATSVLADDEIVTGVTVPPLPAGSGTSFQKLAHTKACIAKVNAAVRLTLDGDRCVQARIALGAVGPTFIRAHGAEALLEGALPAPELIEAVARSAASVSRPQSDVRAGADYRRRMVGVLASRALTEAARTAREGS